MKKILMVLAVFCFIAAPETFAQNKALLKAMKKEKKEKMKEYERENWKLLGSSRSLEVALLSHYDKLEALGEDGKEIVGIAPKCKSKNVGHQMAINNACITYSQQAGSSLKDRKSVV